MYKAEEFAYIPTWRPGLGVVGCSTMGFPWFPAARALAFLWTPKHRLAANHNPSLPISSQFTEPSASCTQTQIVFIIGPPGSGKRELLREAYRLHPAHSDDEAGTLRGWACPVVDILIVPTMDGLSLRSMWTSGSVEEPAGAGEGPACDNKELMGKINLSHQIPVSLFQDWAGCWKKKDVRNTHHPQFLFQGLHLLSPEHQDVLLDLISSERRQSQSTARRPFFLTVTSLPTEMLARGLPHLSGPGVYYIDMHAWKPDNAVLEGFFASWPDQKLPLPPFKLSKLARILAASPRSSSHIKKLLRLRHSPDAQWENRLDPILAAHESEAWLLIDEHLADIVTDEEGGDRDLFLERVEVQEG